MQITRKMKPAIEFLLASFLILGLLEGAVWGLGYLVLRTLHWFPPPGGAQVNPTYMYCIGLLCLISLAAAGFVVLSTFGRRLMEEVAKVCDEARKALQTL